MMRIAAYIHPSRTALDPTGVGKHMIHMVLGLSRRPDVQVELFTSRRELIDGRIDPRSPLVNLPTRGHPLSRLAMEQCWLRLRRPAADHWAGHPDWIYCPAEAFVAVKRARFAATIHCVNWFEPLLPWYGSPRTVRERRHQFPRWKRILNDAHLVLAVSEFLKQRITVIFGTDPARMAVVGNGVEEEFFAAAQQPPPRLDDDPYVLVVGGLTQRKGADYVFPVAAELAKRDPRLQIRVSGVNEPAYFERSKSFPNIAHIGYQGTNTLPGVMRRSIAVMFLSRYETFGIPAAEAMAAATPAVVANFAALPEIVGDAGIVVDVHQPQSVVESILRLREDQAYRQEVIARGRRRSERFHWSGCVERLIVAMTAP